MEAGGGVNGYRFGVTCPTCGNPLRHVASGRPMDTGTFTTAVAHCVGNDRHRWQVVARLVAVHAGAAHA